MYEAHLILQMLFQTSKVICYLLPVHVIINFFGFSPSNLLFILCPCLMALFNCMINNTELKIAWKEIFVYTSIYLSELKNTTEFSSHVACQQNDIHCCDLPNTKRE